LGEETAATRPIAGEGWAPTRATGIMPDPLPQRPAPTPESRTTTVVFEIPDCEVCRVDGHRPMPAYAKARIPLGTWAYVCVQHFTLLGCSLGKGRGQRLILSADAVKDGVTG
jgi:hypothetical protein